MAKSTIIPKESLENIEHEFSILKLIYHRNKNQHRVATWWKHLNQLKRYLSKLISLIHTYNKNSKDVIRTKILRVSRHIYFDLSKSAYRAFNGIIALGQFITLGLTLVGLLGKIYHEIGMIEGLHEKKVQNPDSRKAIEAVPSYGDEELGEELGEEIGEVVREEPVSIPKLEKKRKSTDFNEDLLKKKKKKKVMEPEKSKDVKKVNKSDDKPVKKKKKKKSAIDDIFG